MNRRVIGSCLPEHNELSILDWHFDGSGADVLLLGRVHRAWLMDGHQGRAARGGGGGGGGWGGQADRSTEEVGQGVEGGAELSGTQGWEMRKRRRRKGKGSRVPQLQPLMLRASSVLPLQGKRGR